MCCCSHVFLVSFSIGKLLKNSSYAVSPPRIHNVSFAFQVLQKQLGVPSGCRSCATTVGCILWVGAVWINAYTEHLLTGVSRWLSQATYTLWMSHTPLSEMPMTSAVNFTSAYLLVLDQHAFSFPKTFSTSCLVCDYNLTPLPGFVTALCNTWEPSPRSLVVLLGSFFFHFEVSVDYVYQLISTDCRCQEKQAK